MKSQTALVARKCRLNEWARMVHDCKTPLRACPLMNGASLILSQRPTTIIA